jgi:Kef-type K+ transport system membrane component KefB
VGSQLTLLIAFLGFVAAVGLLIAGFERSSRVTKALATLQDTTAEIRVRGATALLMLFTALATTFGLEAILGAFLAGATIKFLDRDRAMTHALFHVKIQAVGFGVFVPFFFISTGMSLDVRSLVDNPSTLVKVPIFLAGLLIARAVPAVLYSSLAERSGQLLAAGLLQATSLSIPIVAGAVGVDLGLLRPSNYAALVAAGLLSVVLFPLGAIPRLGSGTSTSGLKAPGKAAWGAA